MVIALLVLLLALLLFAAGFAMKALWWVAVAVLVLWIFGFVFPSADDVEAHRHWYRW
ncbi:hydrophobic protein [Streptomyces sp. NPDC059083]|uniref:hypothetical protein n=1 Tax=Actinomycetes TaxID=1760 RepID=UPI0033AF3996